MENKKLFWTSLIIVFALIFVISAVQLVRIFFTGRFDSTQYKNEPEDTASNVSSEILPDNPIDFAALSAQNYDAYAWITIPGTNVDYPILQAYYEDDNFYLDHDINKEKSRAGSLYTQRANQKNFSDPNTIIYGHNMANGTMFRTLHRYKEKSFFEENKYIYIYTPGNIYTYEIFAAYRYDNRHILNSFDFSDKQVFSDYIDSILSLKSNANINTEIEVNENSKIVTLSTCYANSQKQYRYLVQGVLIKNEKTK